jgi:xanthine/CO dehydrogenase XdhC/CoxF family maturation factor
MTMRGTNLRWKKSSYSGNQGGACIEAAVVWRKSTYSGNQGGECIETTVFDHAIGVRDSKDTRRGHLTLSSASWSALTESIKR